MPYTEFCESCDKSFIGDTIASAKHRLNCHTAKMHNAKKKRKYTKSAKQSLVPVAQQLDNYSGSMYNMPLGKEIVGMILMNQSQLLAAVAGRILSDQ